MTIKHLVISGGGPIGISFLGAIEYLSDINFINITEIETFYATSIGTIFSAILCLNYDWPTINKYIIERPWKDIFKLSAKQIMETYTIKGLYDIKIMEKMFKPLLEAKDLLLSITLKEFYEYSKIEMYFYAFDLNSFETIEFSYKSHPDLQLTKAVYMSCSIPGIFIPTFLDDKCLIDGYPLANFPINYCLRDHSEKDDILGFNFICANSDGEKVSNNNTIKDEKNMLDFILNILTNSLNYITNSIKEETIPNIIEIKTTTGTNNIDDIINFLNSPEYRKSLFDLGVEDGKKFIEQRKLLNKKEEIDIEEKEKEKEKEKDERE